MATTTAVDTTPPAAPFVLTNGSFKTLIAPQVTMVTSLGSIVMELNPSNAPMSTANLLAYVNDGFYDGVLFHRVIPGFVAQAGGFASGLNYKMPTYNAVLLESNNSLSNLRGTIGMARTNAVNSGTSQFYINLTDNIGLDYASATSPGYAVFGIIASGMDVIDKIAEQPTKVVGNMADVPQPEVSIISANQTQTGRSISRTGVVSVGALEAGARWEYSTDSGASWKKGSGTSFTLPEGSYAEHRVQVRQGDKAGNLSAYNGQSEVILVIDKTAPKAIEFTPLHAATGVDVTQTLTITFNEMVTLGTGTIRLKTAAGTVVQEWPVAKGNQSAVTLTIDPTEDLKYATTYSIEIPSGAITDLAGNAYAGTRKFKFTTTDIVSTAAASYTLGSDSNKLSFTGTGDFSGTGNDNSNILIGGAGNDKLSGKGGNDRLTGGGGSDQLFGESGSDTLIGGTDNDYFVFSDPMHKGVDVLVDFMPGEDKIVFIASNFDVLPATLTAADLLIGAGRKLPTNGQHLIYDTKRGELWFDADGLSTTPSMKIALIGKSPHPVLSVTDFVLG